MTKFKTKHKAFALTKMSAAALIIAALLTLALLFTGCKQSAGGSNEGGSSGGSSSGGGTVPKAPFVEGGASLILSPDKLDITVEVTTSDNSPITVKGCSETSLTSGTETVLHAQGTLVILKGKIIDLQVSSRNSYNSNKLIALNVQGLNALQGLNCYENQLTELNVQGLNALRSLHCYENQLTALNVQGLNALQELDCGSNQLTELNVQGLNALQSLYCYSNRLTELNVQGLNALQELGCTRNKLTELNVQGLNALLLLYCYENQFTELNVQGLNALKELYCSGNQLTADAFTKLFDDLPLRTANEGAQCYLYSEYSGVTEGNHKDFTSPGELKTAFDNAKNVKNWKMYKYNANGHDVEI